MLSRLLLISILMFPLGCGGGSATLNGYVEGEYVYLATSLSGTLQARNVNRGDTVAIGQPLFTLEHEFELAAESESKHRVEEAIARLADLKKGKRPSEIAALEARIADAKANLTYTTTELERQRDLINKHTSSKRDFDQAVVNYERAKATLASLTADWNTAKLGARDDEIAAAQAALQGAEQSLVQAQWKVAQKSQSAPVAALVADTFYEVGEWVPAGNPIVSLLPPDRVKVRFFVPQALLPQIQIGQSVTISADQLREPVRARVSYVSPQAEFTPPVIFSKESRAKLVFMVEATPEPGTTVITSLKPGQPVDLQLE